MKAVRAKEFAKALERNGYNLVRTRGSHHVYQDGFGRTVVVPIHGNADPQSVLRSGPTEADL